MTAAPEFVAHSPNGAGEWHLLADHLNSVGALAGEFAASFDGSTAAELAGLLHDLGKADPRFRQYLIDATEGVDSTSPGIGHSAAGAMLASEAGLTHVALAVIGHHSGLPALRDLKGKLAGAAHDAGTVDAIGLWPAPAALTDGSGRSLPRWFGAPSVDRRLRLELFVRMVFSCLVDADRLDTEQHFAPHLASARLPTAPLSVLSKRFHSRREAAIQARAADPVSERRGRIRRSVIDSARALRPGIFTLTSPTGSGKTLTAIEAALEHAEVNSMRRIVFAVPFISVTQQTANVLRGVLDEGDLSVIEHHSAFRPDESTQESMLIRHRLACENWDAPVIVTTSVRLLESLFSRRPSDCRRLHRLARSVIVIDESQSIPWTLLDPASFMLRQLVDEYGATVILMTATQPPFERLSALRDRPEGVIELLPGHKEDFAAFARTRLEVMPGRPAWDEIADRVRLAADANRCQALVVLNTVADAERLFRLLAGTDVVLLSSRLCGAHREEVLATVEHRLANGLGIVLIATQLIEAGIDVDFPVGFRAVGPVPSIAQVAGRVNRHGRRTTGTLTVFDPRDGGMPPGEYKMGTGISRDMLARGVDLLTVDATRIYFDRLLQGVASGVDPEGIAVCRQRLDYPAVDDRFRMIDEETVGVLVPYGDFDPAALVPPSSAAEARRLLRELQRFVVSVRRDIYERALKESIVRELEGLPIGSWEGGYDPDTGLVPHAGPGSEVW